MAARASGRPSPTRRRLIPAAAGTHHHCREGDRGVPSPILDLHSPALSLIGSVFVTPALNAVPASGELRIVRASPERYQEVSRTTVFTPDVMSVTGPSLAGGRLLLRNVREMAAFAVR